MIYNDYEDKETKRYFNSINHVISWNFFFFLDLKLCETENSSKGVISLVSEHFNSHLK